MKHTDKIKPKHHHKPQEREEMLAEGLELEDSEGRQKDSFRHLVQEQKSKINGRNL